VGVYAGIEPTWAAQTNAGRSHIATKVVVQSGIVLNLDAGVSSSYSGVGTSWTDLSGNGNTGTLINGPTYTSSNGGSIAFDGTNDRITTGDMFDPNSNFTFSVWSRTNATSKVHTWISRYSQTGSIQIRVVNTGNNVQVVDNHVVNVGIFADTSISSNQTYNVVVNRSGNVYSCYINGVYRSQFTNANSYTYAANTIGSNYFTATDEYFSGNIYAMSCYNRALTEAEIQQNYNATKGRYGL